MPNENKVPRGSVPVNHAEPQEGTVDATTMQNPNDQTGQQTGQQGQQDQTGQQTDQTGQQNQQGQQADTDQLGDYVAQKILSQIQGNVGAGNTDNDVSPEESIEQQKEQVLKNSNDQIAQVNQKLAEMQEKLENGDLEISKYATEMNRLQQQRFDAQREADRQVNQLDNQLAQQKAEVNQQVRQARERFIEQNPDFVSSYQSGKITQAMQDPQIQNVFGDNPAAVYEHMRSQELAQQNQALQQELDQLKQQQQQAVSAAAANPNAKVGDSAGGTNFQVSQETESKDGMMAAIQAMRNAS